MHKKSNEAARHFAEHDDECDMGSEGDKDEERNSTDKTSSPTEIGEGNRAQSIAELRAKAQEHTDKIQQAFNLVSSRNDNGQSLFDYNSMSMPIAL